MSNINKEEVIIKDIEKLEYGLDIQPRYRPRQIIMYCGKPVTLYAVFKIPGDAGRPTTPEKEQEPPPAPIKDPNGMIGCPHCHCAIGYEPPNIEPLAPEWAMKRLQDWANHYFPDRGGLWDTDLQEIFALMASVNGPPRHKDEEPLAVLADRKGYEVLLGRRRKGQFQEGKWVIQLWGMPGKVEEFPILRVPRNSYQKSEQAARKWLLKQGDKT